MNEFFKKKILKELERKGVNKFTALEIIEVVRADTYSSCLNQVNYAISLIYDCGKSVILSK